MPGASARTQPVAASPSTDRHSLRVQRKGTYPARRMGETEEPFRAHGAVPEPVSCPFASLPSRSKCSPRGLFHHARRLCARGPHVVRRGVINQSRLLVPTVRRERVATGKGDAPPDRQGLSPWGTPSPATSHTALFRAYAPQTPPRRCTRTIQMAIPTCIASAHTCTVSYQTDGCPESLPANCSSVTGR